MSDRRSEFVARLVGGTEFSWCRAITGGTGIAVVAILLSSTPKIDHLQNTLDNLQISHPVLRSNLRFDVSSDTFSFVTSAASRVKIQTVDSASTAQIIQNSDDPCADPHRIILEHELNKNMWIDPERWTNSAIGLFFVSLYDLRRDGQEQWILTFQLNTAACDRTSAVTLLREFMNAAAADDCGTVPEAVTETAGLGQAIEDLIPSGKGNKPFWARGIDVLGYSLNALRFANLDFVDADESSTRRSQIVRLRFNRDQSLKLMAGCKARGIKLWATLAAAGLISAYSSKHLPPDQGEKYAVVTLPDCRSSLEPPLTCNDFGFYHSGILHTHDITGEETLWYLAKRCHESFTIAKNSNKQFTDMSDLNFLMCKAIENPHLTASSSLRTAFISIFEDPVIEECPESVFKSVGVEDYIGCASIHGVGPSIAVFDTLRHGELECAFVYPSPLHSREQMNGLVQHMKAILLEGSA